MHHTVFLWPLPLDPRRCQPLINRAFNAPPPPPLRDAKTWSCKTLQPFNPHSAAQAVAGPAAVEHMNRLDAIVSALAARLKVKTEDIPARVAGEKPFFRPDCSNAGGNLCVSLHESGIVYPDGILRRVVCAEK